MELAGIGYAYAVAGREKEAQEILNALIQQAEQRYVPPIGIAIIYAGLGEKGQAFEWLEKAYEDRNWHLTLLKVEPIFDSLRSDPRFQVLLQKVGLD